MSSLGTGLSSHDLRKQARKAAWRLLVWLFLLLATLGYIYFYIGHLYMVITYLNHEYSIKPLKAHQPTTLFIFGSAAYIVWRLLIAWSDRKYYINELGKRGEDVRWNRGIIAAYIAGVFVVAAAIVNAWATLKHSVR